MGNLSTKISTEVEKNKIVSNVFKDDDRRRANVYLAKIRNMTIHVELYIVY